MTFILPKKTRVLWQLRIAVAFIFVCVIIFAIVPLNLWALLLVWFIAAFGLFVVFFYVPVFIKNYKIMIYNDCLCIYKGVFIKSLIVLPCVRLVIVKRLVTPITSLFKLHLVLLKVARGWIFIPELDSNVSERLLSIIQGEIYE